jgi:tRNA threonylcarbamoyladenosine biosynthesis protein TsaB
MILTLRTDKPEAEIGLYDGLREAAYIRWHADRNLSVELNRKLEETLDKQGAGYEDLTGIVLYKGPGSFTGLRIGASVANTLAFELDIPIAGSNGDDWINRGIGLLASEPERRMVILEYGEPPKTTKPRK